jgi:hypothetical protein
MLFSSEDNDWFVQLCFRNWFPDQTSIMSWPYGVLRPARKEVDECQRGVTLQA